MNRRQFLFAPAFRPRRQEELPIEVLEVFEAGAAQLLIGRHADAARRDAFIRWLRSSDGQRVRLRTPDGATVSGFVFRMKMCFGRALILLDHQAALRPKDRIAVAVQA